MSTSLKCLITTANCWCACFLSNVVRVQSRMHVIKDGIDLHSTFAKIRPFTVNKAVLTLVQSRGELP